MLKKYKITLLLTFLVFTVVSCQKGGEPVPYMESSHVCGDIDNSSARVGEIGFYNENTGGPVLDPGGTGVGGGTGPGGGTGGGTGTGGETVVGGDDNEDDDDDGVGAGNAGGGGNGG